MKTKFALSLAVAAACVAALAEPLTCASPDGKNALTFALGEKGEPTYSFAYRGKKVVEPSTLGFDIKALGKDAFEGRKPGELRTGFVLSGVERASADATWRPLWGEESEIRDRHEEMLVKLVQKGTGRRMDLRFRVFDDGMGFRYEFPADDTPSRGSFRARTSRPRERPSRSPTSRSSRSARASTFRATPRRGGFRRTTRRRSTATRSRASARYRASSRPRRTRTFRPRSPTSRRCRPR